MIAAHLARILKLKRAYAPPATPDAAYERMLIGRWTWDDVYLAAVDDLDRIVADIICGAAPARQRRDAGDRPWLGLPIHVASEIVSYHPDETPPPQYRELIERDMVELHDGPKVLTEPRFVEACFVMAAMRTPDAMVLRRYCWG